MMRIRVISTVIAVVAIFTARAPADIIHDFSAVPIVWDSSGGPISWDADGDMVDDFQILVTEGFTDTSSGLYVIDNTSTSSGGITKTFTFSIAALNPSLDQCEFNLLGFDFYSEKNIEPGGKGGAGSVSIDVFDDRGTELVNGINVTGSLGSSPTNVVLPGLIPTEWFTIAVDLDSPPGNDDAQVVLGDFVINGGTVRCFSSIPEPGVFPLLLGALLTIAGQGRASKSRRG